MVEAQRMINRRDLSHPVQYFIEGTGPTNYERALGGNETGIAPFQLGVFEVNNAPEFEDNYFSGNIDRQGRIQTWEANTITVSGRVLNTTQGLRLLEFACNKPPLTYDDSTAPGTNDNKHNAPKNRHAGNSLTWMYSFGDFENKLNYVIARGCVISNASLDFPNKGIVMLNLTYDVRSLYAIKTAIDVSNPPAANDAVTFTASNKTGIESAAAGSKISFATAEDESLPLRFSDSGDFYYKPRGAVDGKGKRVVTNLPYQTMNIGIDWTLRRQDANGSDRTLYLDQGSRSGTGNISFFKRGVEINEDARVSDQHTAWMEIARDGTADVHAKLGITSNSPKGYFYASAPGAIGNEVYITVKTPTGTDTAIKVEGKKITITPANNATWTAVKTAIEADPVASKLIYLSLDTTPGNAAAISETQLTGGDDNKKKIVFENFSFQPSWESMRGDSEATIESKAFNGDTITAKIV